MPPTLARKEVGIYFHGASEYYNMPDVDPTFLNDAMIKHYISLLQQKYISHWQHVIQNSKKLEFYNDEYTPSCYLDLTRTK